MHSFGSAAMGLLAAASMAAITPAEAVDLNKSRLSTIELKKCRQLSRHKDGGAWLCPGLKGYPVYLAEGDLRQMLAFGPQPQKRRSATQTLGPFNTVFEARQRPTIEWRVESDARGRIVPFATIVRLHISRDGQKSDVLVITKVDAKDSCQLAAIDAQANTDAMALARAWAIAEAKKASCPDRPKPLGKAGKIEF